MLSEKLRNARTSKGITQDYVAKQLYVSRQTVSRWEQGKTLPNIHVLKKLSEIYNVSVENLTDETNSENKRKEETKIKKIHYLPLIGSILFNVFLFSIVILIAISLLLVLWAIPITFILSPSAVLVAVQIGINAFDLVELSLGIILALIGIFVLPLSKKITTYLVILFKRYIKYNHKSIYH